MACAKSKASPARFIVSLEIEAGRWLTADKLRTSTEAAEDKHGVLGPVSLKYISDMIKERRAKLILGEGDSDGRPRTRSCVARRASHLITIAA